MKSTHLFFLSLLIFSLFTACDKKDDCGVSARFENLTGLDGCGFVLTTGSGSNLQTLEVTNLDDFNITPTDGMKVCIQYVPSASSFSACQTGQIVDLTSIVER